MKPYTAWTLIYCLIFQFTGCYTPYLATREELISTTDYPGLFVRTNDQNNYAFESGSYVIRNDSIIGKGSLVLDNGVKVDRNVDRYVSLDKIESIKLEKIDGTKTTFCIVALLGLTVLFGLAIKSIMKDATASVASHI